jgi:O-antigen/teichoic acid export membrane protein
VAQAVAFSAAAWVVSRRAARAAAAAAAAAPVASAPEAVGTPGLLRQMFGYCLPLLGARAAFLSGQNLGKVLLAKVMDATQLGYFTFAFQTIERFVELAYTVPSALLPSLTHLVTRAERERLGYIFDQAFRLVQVVACAVAWLLFAFAPELTLFVGSPLFLPSVGILHVLALVPIARTAQQPLTMLFQAMRRPGLVLALSLLKLGVELACYLIIVPKLGGLGAAWANLAGAAVSFAAALGFAAVVLPESAALRASVVARALLLVLPLLGLTWLLLPQEAPSALSLLARMLLTLPAAFALFPLRLVTRYDLEKLSGLRLRAAPARRLRDLLVRAVDPLARLFEPRRTA